jgi:hypothetical protein
VTPDFVPPGSRSTAAILALYVKVGACLLAIGALVGRILVARGLEDGTLLVDDLLDADRLVVLGTTLEALALVVALAFFLRWFVTIRGNREALGGPEERPALWGPWLVALGLAVVAVVLSWTALGEAEDVGDRQRIDAFRAGATALSAVATGLTIAVVSSLTRRQQERAAELGLPRVPERPDPPAESVSAGGLRVVSEEQARGPEADT